MKKLVPSLLYVAAVSAAVSAAAAGCGQPPTDDPGTSPARTGGASGSGSGGKAAGGSSGGSGGTSAGSGGSTSSGGSPGGSGGVTGTGGTPSTSTGGSSGSPDASPADVAAPSDAPSTPPAGAGGYPLCPRCKPLFDGKNLDQWLTGAPGAWVIKDGAMASTGKPNDTWTKEDFGNYRIFFTLRQVTGSHQPGTIYFGNRNGDKPARGLAGIQIQPPNGYTWDYRPGKNNSGAALFMKLPAPKLDVKQWSQCEALVKESGEIRFGCCQVSGTTPCKATESLRFKDATAGKKAPFGIQMHNAGLFDEYKDIWVETDPTVDDLLSTK
jgi:hypothetical protein